VKFHKNIAEDLTTVDRKRKESPLDEGVEQEEYDAKMKTSRNIYFLIALSIKPKIQRMRLSILANLHLMGGLINVIRKDGL